MSGALVLVVTRADCSAYVGLENILCQYVVRLSRVQGRWLWIEKLDHLTLRIDHAQVFHKLWPQLFRLDFESEVWPCRFLDLLKRFNRICVHFFLTLQYLWIRHRAQVWWGCNCIERLSANDSWHLMEAICIIIVFKSSLAVWTWSDNLIALMKGRISLLNVVSIQIHMLLSKYLICWWKGCLHLLERITDNAVVMSLEAIDSRSFTAC